MGDLATFTTVKWDRVKVNCTTIDRFTCKKQPRYTPWRRLGGEEYTSYSFSTSTLDGGWVVRVTPRPRFSPGERTLGTQCTGGWVGLRAGLDTETRGNILCPRRESNPDRPVVQPVARHYTAWATRLTNYSLQCVIFVSHGHINLANIS
jgi:hypothetical protein